MDILSVLMKYKQGENIMKKSTRAVSLAIALILAVTPALTGCSSSSKNAAPKAKPAPVTLKWYFGGTWPQPDQSTVFNAVNKYIEQKINAKIDFVPIDFGDYDSKISVVIASGESFDVCFTSNWSNSYTANVAKGAYLPLDDLLKKDAPKTYASVPSTFWNAVKINGKIYGVVNQQISARVAPLIVPADEAKQFGFSPNSFKQGDLSSMTPYLTKVHAAKPNEYVAVDVTDIAEYLGQDDISGWDIPGAINVNDPTLKVFNQFESPEWHKLKSTLQQWNKDGFMAVSRRITGTTTDPEADRKAHLEMATVAGTYKPGDLQMNEADFGFPVEEIPTNKSILTTSGITATLQAISRTSKHPDKAMQMLEIFNTDKKAFNLLNYGILGVHYKLDSDGFLVPGPSASKYNPDSPWLFATNYMAYVTKGQPKDVWAQTKALNNSALKSPLLGFTFNPEPVKSDIAKCQAVMASYKNGLSLGYYSDDQYAKMLSQLKAAGSDSIIAEMQKQIRAWKSSK
jgi:ABC-type sugar transport system, periplasmic component